MISVVICTRNRAPALERCLRHMTEVRHGAGLAWELVVVDNASADATRAVIDRFAESLPLKYAFEAARGLSHARNCGIAESKYPIVAFTDDDCLVNPNWVGAIVGEFENRPEVSILGGRVELADPGDHPVATRVHDCREAITGIQQLMRLMIGCNMACRRGLFDTIGLFDPVFGKGTRIGSAEDLDFLYRALKRGIGIAYSPDIVVRHAHARNAPAALESAEEDYVKGRGAFYWKFLGDRDIAKMAYWEIRAVLKESPQPHTGAPSRRVLRSLATGALCKFVGEMRSGAVRAVNRFIG